MQDGGELTEGMEEGRRKERAVVQEVGSPARTGGAAQEAVEGGATLHGEEGRCMEGGCQPQAARVEDIGHHHTLPATASRGELLSSQQRHGRRRGRMKTAVILVNRTVSAKRSGKGR